VARWRNGFVAVVLGVVVLAAGLAAWLDVPAPAGEAGYSVADPQAHVAAVDVEAAAVSSPSRAPLVLVRARTPLTGRPGPAATRPRLVARDRSPPAR
jgi:hypothetical protein